MQNTHIERAYTNGNAPVAYIRGGSAVVQIQKEQWFGQGWKDACWAVGWLPNKAKEKGGFRLRMAEKRQKMEEREGKS